MTSLVKAKAKIATTVPSQTPEFVREDHQQLVRFLQAYYEWMELQGNAGFFVRNLEDLYDIDKTVDSFVEYFKKELLVDIPQIVLTDKRLLAKHIIDLYQSKGAKQSYQLLFRILFDEEIELYYPKVDLLRSSDGKYTRKIVIKVIDVQGDSFKLLGQTLTQNSPLATATVESVVKYSVGANTISELTLSESSIVGTFKPNVTIYGLDNETGSIISLMPQSLISDVDVVDQGSYYSVGDRFTISNNSGVGFNCEVSAVRGGVVTDILVIDPGTGYEPGTELLIDSADTNGSGLRAVIEEVYTDAFKLEGSIDSRLLLEHGGSIIPEYTNRGGIKRVKVLDVGYGYNKLPIVTAPSIPGFGAKLAASGSDIGRVSSVAVTGLGVYYDNKPVASSQVNCIIQYLTPNTFSQGEYIFNEPEMCVLENGGKLLSETDDVILLERQINGVGYYSSFDTNRSLLTLSSANTIIRISSETSQNLISESGLKFITEDSGEFTENQTIQGLTTGARARILKMRRTNVNPIQGISGAYVGTFIGSDGTLSDYSKKIQDSYYYQDFSYVIKAGRSIDQYKDAVKKLLHPVGLMLFGEVSLNSYVSATSPSFGNPITLTRYVRLMISYIQSKLVNVVPNYTLVFPGFVKENMQLHILRSDILPTLIIDPPKYLHILDMQVEVVRSELLQQTPEDVTIVDATSNLTTHRELESVALRSSVKYVGGNTLASLDKWKFSIPPYSAGVKDAWNQAYPTPNDGYWSEYANTQIKDFSSITVDDIINNPEKRVDINVHESYVDIVTV